MNRFLLYQLGMCNNTDSPSTDSSIPSSIDCCSPFSHANTTRCQAQPPIADGPLLLPRKTECLRRLVSSRQHLLHRIPLQHPLIPSIDIRKLLLHIGRRIPHDEIQFRMEGDITQVRSRALAADEPLFVGELVIQNLQNPTQVLDVASMGLRVGLDEGPVEDAL